MPKIVYIQKNFSKNTTRLIEIANTIIDEYTAQGYDLTLRQLYYKMVARDYIPNSKQSYKQIVGLTKNARLAGMIDWSAITDRTRNLRLNSHWSSVSEIIMSCASQYQIDKWGAVYQEYRPEVWIEKDALVGVISATCSGLDIPYFSCRGYGSTSEMWVAGQRLARHISGGQLPFIIHLGDHDPSGMDMSRDIVDRLEMFTRGKEGVDFHFTRVALNYDQVTFYNPPPNPTKMTDTRATSYISDYGNQCWELDALEPIVINQLITDQVFSIRDEDGWSQSVEREDLQKNTLTEIHHNLDGIISFLGDENA